MRNYYDVLQVTPLASDNEIESAYNRLKAEYSLQGTKYSVQETGNLSEKNKSNLEELEEAYAVLSKSIFRKQYDKKKFPTLEELSEICSLENMAKNFTGNNYINNSFFGFKGKIGKSTFFWALMVLFFLWYVILKAVVYLGAIYLDEHTMKLLIILLEVIFFIIQGGLITRRLRFLGQGLLPLIISFGITFLGIIAFCIIDAMGYTLYPYRQMAIEFAEMFFYGGAMLVGLLHLYILSHSRITEIGGQYVRDDGFHIENLIWLFLYLFFVIMGSVAFPKM